jgi:hypothetical protein
MPKLDPPTSFLLRGSGLLIGLLLIWWFALLDPMLYGLRTAANLFVDVDERPSGDWGVRVPLHAVIPATNERLQSQTIESIDFNMSRSDAIAFTFSVPVFWAIVLAAPGPIQRRFRPMLIGTVAMASIEVLLLLIFAQVTARNVLAQSFGIESAAAAWRRQICEYLVVNVLPYVVPFVVALCIDRQLSRAVGGQLRA